MFSTHSIIVIIPTSLGRTDLLLNRSLKSVYGQIDINPRQVYIVDDNKKLKNQKYSDEYFKIKRGIEFLRENILEPKFKSLRQQKKINIEFENFFPTRLIQNKRTQNHSGTGAWNSAAFEILKNIDEKCWLAFLDDDDYWQEHYLTTLCQQITEQTIAVISGLSKVEKDKKIHLQANENNFTKENFFIGNPGLQGSNLFIELETFWAIGGFDESLKSEADRDLAIRLIEYQQNNLTKKIAFVNEILVDYYAISSRRMTSISKNKQKGLDTFYRKYFHQFPKKSQQRSLQQAQILFNYIIPKSVHKQDNFFNNKTEIKKVKPFNLLLGTISDNITNLKNLFNSFTILFKKYGHCLIDYRIVILANTDNENKIKLLIENFIAKKNLKIALITNVNGYSSIAQNRTFLQKKIYHLGKKIFNNDFITWIIDDDLSFEFDTQDGLKTLNYFEIISKQSSKRVDAMFGLNSDAPPLPSLSTLRTQLVDFYYNLTYFINCHPLQKFELNTWQQKNVESKDFYYDLSDKNFQHLEYPYYRQYSKALTNFQVFKQFLKETVLLSKGQHVFRKLIFKPETIGRITQNNSIYRGGNTVIFNSQLLKIPNYTPDKGYNRRSDFNWAIINKNVFKRKLSEIVLPLKHNRGQQKTSLIVNEKKLAADIKGLIFYRVLEYILSKDNWQTQTNIKDVLKYYRQIKRLVLTKVKINHDRVRSLIDLILEILKNVKYWWFQNGYRNEIHFDIRSNIATLEVLRIELRKSKFRELLENLEKDMKMDDQLIKKIINEIKKIANANFLE